MKCEHGIDRSENEYGCFICDIIKIPAPNTELLDEVRSIDRYYYYENYQKQFEKIKYIDDFAEDEVFVKLSDVIQILSK